MPIHSSGLAASALAWHDHGCHVALAVDAMTDRDPAAHRRCVERILPRLGETTMTAEALSLLEQSPGRQQSMMAKKF
jgi:hypothetical protein